MIIFIESHLAAVNITGFYKITPFTDTEKACVTVHLEYKDIDGNKDTVKLSFKASEYDLMRKSISSILTQMKEVDNYLVTTALEDAIRKTS